MADSFITVRDTETQTDKKIRIRDNGDGTFSYAEAEGGFFLETTGLSVNSLNGDLVPATNVSAFKWFSLQVLGTWTGTLTFQGSNDNTNWASVAVININSAGGNVVSTTTGNGLFHGPIAYKWLRVRMTGSPTGTATGVLMLFSTAAVLNSFGIAASQQGTWTVSVGTPTTGGLNDYHKVSAATNNADTVKGSAGQLFGYDISNTNAAWRYVKLYNKATNPSPGSDTPFRTIGVPPGGKVTHHQPAGIAFGTGIAIAMVTGLPDNDNNAVGLGDLIVELDYK